MAYLHGLARFLAFSLLWLGVSATVYAQTCTVPTYRAIFANGNDVPGATAEASYAAAAGQALSWLSANGSQWCYPMSGGQLPVSYSLTVATESSWEVRSYCNGGLSTIWSGGYAVGSQPCPPPPPPTCPPAGTPAGSWTWAGRSMSADLCEEQCGISTTGDIGYMVDGSWQVRGSGTYTGQNCTAGTGGSIGTSGDAGTAPTPTTATPGTCNGYVGEVNGTTVCIPGTQTDATQTGGTTTTESTTTTPSGSTTTESTTTTPDGGTSSTICTGTNCATTTTTVVPGTGGAPSTTVTNTTNTPKPTFCQANPGSVHCTATPPSGTTTGTTTNTTENQTTCTATTCTTTTTTTTNTNGTTSTQTTNTSTPRPAFCSSNPSSPHCTTSGNGSGGEGTESAFGGTCGGTFTCSGDAVQCAIARATNEQKCIFEKQSAEATLYESSKASTDGGIPQETVAVGSFDSSNALGVSGACIPDLQVTVWGSNLSLPFSQVCPYLAHFGTLLLAVSWLMAFAIVARRS